MSDLEKNMVENVIRSSELIEPEVFFEADPPRFMILVLSDSFKEMGEAERQEKIWNILHRLPDEIVVNVSFAFTNTREEEDAYEDEDDDEEGEDAAPAPDTQGA